MAFKIIVYNQINTNIKNKRLFLLILFADDVDTISNYGLNKPSFVKLLNVYTFMILMYTLCNKIHMNTM